MLELEHARQLLVDFKMPEAACQLDACLESAARQDASFISFFGPDSNTAEKGTRG